VRLSLVYLSWRTRGLGARAQVLGVVVDVGVVQADEQAAADEVAGQGDGHIACREAEVNAFLEANNGEEDGVGDGVLEAQEREDIPPIGIN